MRVLGAWLMRPHCSAWQGDDQSSSAVGSPGCFIASSSVHACIGSLEILGGGHFTLYKEVIRVHSNYLGLDSYIEAILLYRTPACIVYSGYFYLVCHFLYVLQNCCHAVVTVLWFLRSYCLAGNISKVLVLYIAAQSSIYNSYIVRHLSNRIRV